MQLSPYEYPTTSSGTVEYFSADRIATGHVFALSYPELLANIIHAAPGVGPLQANNNVVFGGLAADYMVRFVSTNSQGSPQSTSAVDAATTDHLGVNARVLTGINVNAVPAGPTPQALLNLANFLVPGPAFNIKFGEPYNPPAIAFADSSPFEFILKAGTYLQYSTHLHITNGALNIPAGTFTAVASLQVLFDDMLP